MSDPKNVQNQQGHGSTKSPHAPTEDEDDFTRPFWPENAETQLAGFRDGYQDVSEELQGLSHRELGRALGRHVENVRECVLRFGGLGPGRSGVLRPIYSARWRPFAQLDQICPNPLTGGRVRKITAADRVRAEALEQNTWTTQLWAELASAPSRFGDAQISESGPADPASLREPLGAARLFPGAWTLRAILESRLTVENRYFQVRIVAVFQECTISFPRLGVELGVAPRKPDEPNNQ